MDSPSNWIQIAYQYGIGGIFLGMSLWLCFREGGARFSNPQDRKSLWILLGGYFGYLIFNLLWAYFAQF